MTTLKILAVICLFGSAASDTPPERELQSPCGTVAPPAAAPPPVQSPCGTVAPPAAAARAAPTPKFDPAVVGGSVAAGLVGVTAIGLGVGLGGGLGKGKNTKSSDNGGLGAARAVDDMLDAAVYIMASIARCGGHDTIRCEVDVASAIESVNRMVNVILKAIDTWGALHSSHAKCGLSVGVLTRSMAGLAAASGGIVAKCPNKLNGMHPMMTVGDTLENAHRYGGAHRAYNVAGFSNGLGQCVINIKDTVKSLFKAIKRIMTVKENCADPTTMHCAHNSVKIVAAFTGLAEYISGSIAKCSANSGHTVNAVCAQMSIRLFHAIEEVDRASIGIARDCHITEADNVEEEDLSLEDEDQGHITEADNVEEEDNLSLEEEDQGRLYREEEDNAASVTPASSSGSVTLALAALLPLTAVMGFLGGMRLQNARTQTLQNGHAHSFTPLRHLAV